MEGKELELIVLGLVAGATALLLVAERVRVPYPILLMVGGLGLGFVPGLPDVTLPPELVFLVFLPPLLYAAAYFSSLRELRANLRPISLLAVGLVLATTLTVAVAAHEVIGLDWPAAFVLGAIVAPTDPIAATAIASRLGAPRRTVVIVEGESLINDATALVAYRVAVGAVTAGTFSLAEAGLEFIGGVAAGAAIGLAVGWLVAQLRRRTEDALTEISVSLATAYFAYLPAELLHVSGVIAAVTAGVYLGWRAPELTEPSARLQANGFWEALIFLINVTLFVLIGLQLPVVVDGLEGESAVELGLWALLVSGAVIATRIVWVFAATAWLPRRLSRRVRTRDPLPPWRWSFLVSWIGMRGAVTLAAALALPLETDSGASFADRDLIVFLAFSVVVATLLAQGLSLPSLIRRLGLEDSEAEDWRDAEARLRAAERAIARLEELEAEDWVRDDTVERLRGLYDYRRRRFAARVGYEEPTHDYEERSADYQRLRRELIEAERAAVLDLRSKGVINDEVMRGIERDLDLEATRLEP